MQLPKPKRLIAFCVPLLLVGVAAVAFGPALQSGRSSDVPMELMGVALILITSAGIVLSLVQLRRDR